MSSDKSTECQAWQGCKPLVALPLDVYCKIVDEFTLNVSAKQFAEASGDEGTDSSDEELEGADPPDDEGADPSDDEGTDSEYDEYAELQRAKLLYKAEIAARRNCLKNLSLTCRSLRPLCQRHLFYTISIYLSKGRKQGPSRGKERLQIFMTLAENSAVPLATYIRQLHFTFYLLRALEDESAELASRFLSQVHNIESFYLNGSYDPESEITCPNKSMYWLTLKPTLAEHLLQVIQSPNLQMLALNAMKNFPFYALPEKKASQLSWLSINYVTAGKGPKVHQADSQADRRSNRSLLPSISGYNDKSCNGAATPAPVGEPCFPRLKDFTFFWDLDNGIDGIEALMHYVLKLESLTTTVEHGDTHFTFEGLAKMILHGSFRTLRDLNITITCLERFIEHDLFGNIHEEFKKLAMNSSCLECIILNFNLQGLWTEVGNIRDGCDSIDRLFASRNPFPSLQTLAIIVRFRHDTNGDEEVEERADDLFYNEVDAMRKSCFRNISDVSTIDFSFDVEHIWT